MNVDEPIKRATSGEIPAGVMGGVGILVLLLAVKSAKGVFKILFVLVALTLLAGAVWWHFHQRH